MYMHIIKIKFHFPGLLLLRVLYKRIFTKSNISKVLIIFTVGLISRIAIGYYYDINVFLEYYRAISLTYYSLMAIFVVVLSEVFTYFDFNIIPSFIFEYYGIIRESLSRFGLESKSMIMRIFRAIKQINLSIYHLLRSMCDGYINARDIKTNIFNSEDNKLTIGNSIASQEHELPEVNKENKPVKISNVLHKGHKGEDNFILSKTTYKPSANAASTSRGEGSSRLDPNYIASQKGKGVDTASNKSKPSLDMSDGSRSITFGIGINDSHLRVPTHLASQAQQGNIPTPSSVYSPYNPLTSASQVSQASYEVRQQGDFVLYPNSRASQEGSGFATPQTMSPLFGGSRASPASGSVRSSMHSYTPHTLIPSQHAPQGASHAPQGNSDYPAPLNIRQDNQANMTLRRNSHLSTPRSSAFIGSSGSNISNISFNNRPYDLSANRVLPNVAFDRVANVRNAIPLNDVSYSNRTLPVIPRNYESTLDNVAATPRIDDPCSFDYQSRHRNPSSMHINRYRTPRTADFISMDDYRNQEVVIKKPGIRGKVKLGFKTLGNKFSNGISKIESAYVHYETVSKRHIIWNLFEENKGNYENYEDFKQSWDSNVSLWNEIKNRTKKDLKADIEDLLGIRGNRPPIGTSLNREIDDLLRNNRPFAPTVPQKVNARDLIVEQTDLATASIGQEEQINTHSHRNRTHHKTRKHGHGHKHK